MDFTPIPLHAKARAAGITQLAISERIGRNESITNRYLSDRLKPSKKIAPLLAEIEKECHTVIAHKFGQTN